MKKILFILLLLVVILAIIPLFLPKTLHVEQEYVYDAPTGQVFDHFNDLKKFTAFDAWSKTDPNIKLNYSSPSSGEGASYQWESKDRNLGKGSMSITDLRENEFIDYKLQFGEMGDNTAQAIFQKMEDGKTKVIWSFDSGEAGYPFQVFNVLMKGTVQNNLKQGMINLDSILTKYNAANYPNQNIDSGGMMVVEAPAKRLFGVLQQTTTLDEEMSTAMNESFGLVHSYLKDANQLTDEQIGPPVVLWKQYDTDADAALFYCGFFVQKNIAETGDFEFVEIPQGKFLSTVHNGAYDAMGVTYARMKKFAESRGLELSDNTYDVYLNDATTTPETELKTQIYIPILK